MLGLRWTTPATRCLQRTVSSPCPGVHCRNLRIPTDPPHLPRPHPFPQLEEGGLPDRGPPHLRARQVHRFHLKPVYGSVHMDDIPVCRDAGVVYSEIRGSKYATSSSRALKEVLYPGNSGYYAQTGGSLENLRYNTTIEKVRHKGRQCENMMLRCGTTTRPSIALRTSSSPSPAGSTSISCLRLSG